MSEKFKMTESMKENPDKYFADALRDIETLDESKQKEIIEVIDATFALESTKKRYKALLSKEVNNRANAGGKSSSSSSKTPAPATQPSTQPKKITFDVMWLSPSNWEKGGSVSCQEFFKTGQFNVKEFLQALVEVKPRDRKINATRKLMAIEMLYKTPGIEYNPDDIREAITSDKLGLGTLERKSALKEFNEYYASRSNSPKPKPKAKPKEDPAVEFTNLLLDDGKRQAFLANGGANKRIRLKVNGVNREYHPLLIIHNVSGIVLREGHKLNDEVANKTVNQWIQEFLEAGAKIDIDTYKKILVHVAKTNVPVNYKGFGLLSHHVLKQELEKQPPNTAYITEVMKALAQVPEAGFEDIRLSTNLLDKLKTHSALLDELRQDPKVEAFLQRHEAKAEVITEEKPLPYGTIKKENGETPEVWFARVAGEHDKVANGNENSKHREISVAYGEIAKLYKELKGKRGDERKEILTRLAKALSKVNASNSPYHTLLITPETGGSTGKLSEAQMLLGYQGAVAEELRKMRSKRIIKKPPQPFPVPTTQPKIDTEELERKKKALDAMAAARHDGAQEKTWWQRNKEWIYWLIGILVVSALGVFAFRKGGWFNKDKKSSSVAVTPNTNTNSNTNTNTNTGGGLADNSTLYKADEVCDALAGNSRVPPTFSNNGR